VSRGASQADLPIGVVVLWLSEEARYFDNSRRLHRVRVACVCFFFKKESFSGVFVWFCCAKKVYVLGFHIKATQEVSRQICVYVSIITFHGLLLFCL